MVIVLKYSMTKLRNIFLKISIILYSKIYAVVEYKLKRNIRQKKGFLFNILYMQYTRHHK